MKPTVQEFIKDQFTREDASEFPSLLNLLLTNNVTKALNEQGQYPLFEDEELKTRLNEYFDGDFNATWAEALDNFDNVMKIISTYLSCFDFNKFVAMPNEYLLEVEGINLISENKLWAGLVFKG